MLITFFASDSDLNYFCSCSLVRTANKENSHCFFHRASRAVLTVQLRGSSFFIGRFGTGYRSPSIELEQNKKRKCGVSYSLRPALSEDLTTGNWFLNGKREAFLQVNGYDNSSLD